MQAVIDYGAFIIAWAVTLARFRTVLESGWNWRVVKTWLLALQLSLFTTFQIDGVYLAVDRITGVNNLAWLISYLFLVAATYFLGAAFYSRQPRWSFLYCCIVALLLVGIFPFGPGAAPETLDHVTPANSGELAFLVLMYLYVATVIIAVPARVCIRRRREQAGYDRMRTSVVLAALIVTSLSVVTKVFIFSSSFIFPSLPPRFLGTVTNLSRLWAAALAVLWPLGFAPNGFYRLIMRPVAFLRKIQACRELGVLQSWLDRVSPAVSVDDANWLELFGNPDLHIYRRTISVLDRRKALAAWVEQGDQAASSELPAEEMIRVHKGLQGIPASADLDQVVEVCRKLSRQITGGAS